jgi:hypothetical protein
MRVGFTGTQRGMTNAQLATFRSLVRGWRGEFHHGDCVGADEQAHAFAAEVGLKTVCHPPINESKRAFTRNDVTLEPKEYLDRNKDIVRDTEILVATPGEFEEQLRSGTWSTVRYARRMGRGIWIVPPDGKTVVERAGERGAWVTEQTTAKDTPPS